MNIRKLFNCKPRVGDHITAGMDFGVYFEGMVTEDHSGNKDFPHYKADGVVYISTNWNGETQKEVEGEIILAGRARIK